MTTVAASPAAALPTLGFVRVLAPISVAHFCSHFFQFILPPLFPLMKAHYGVTFTELGLLVAIFYGFSGCSQAVVGVVVDRYGAARVLAGGLLLLAVSFTGVAMAPSYAWLLPLMALAGLGNSIFHPCDYSIMSARIEQSRVGRAFSIHALAGTAGYAAAPLTMLALAAFVPWNVAILAPVLLAALTALYILVRRSDFATPLSGGKAATPGQSTGLGVLMHSYVIAAFVLFSLGALPAIGVTAFLPAALLEQFGTPLAITAAAIGAQQAGGAVGVLLGGWLADRAGRHDYVIIAGLLVAGALIYAATTQPIPAVLLPTAFGLAGFAAGLTGPSRDMIVRAIATPETRGRIFGFVYSGYDLGSALVPLALAAILDRGHVGWIAPVIAASYLAMILAMLATTRRHTAKA
ncbi:MAG: MFS transporter [Rhodospirillaceae bacterium]|nr:MFS transporter [Rhodospirillaceae bacterium]